MKQVKEMGIVAVCLLLLGFGICMGIGTYLMYRDGEEEYDNLREYVAVEEPKERKDGETPEENQEETVTVDFEALKKINPEIIEMCIRDSCQRISWDTDEKGLWLGNYKGVDDWLYRKPPQEKERFS